MDSLRGQGGIQMLLTAEQEAQYIISSARNLRTTRLKQAKDEAEREMAVYRSNIEAEYQKKIAETSSESVAERLEEETAKKIKNLKESGSKVSPDVVGMLLKNLLMSPFRCHPKTSILFRHSAKIKHFVYDNFLADVKFN
ncbi:hypothetical protein TIFTF001_043479 [Ficus carica]|uniref:V-type proton ATPase subunit G n=1 Tax=Ficus carica TaxID=3494 RepID=A0AA88CLG8_FICCA|nr:hypothetical protein TIFTF001_043479 [Ficus carica]